MIRNDQLFVQVIDDELLREAATIFRPKGSKKNTLIDCSVVVVARRIKAGGVFSYDDFYRKQGLKLAEDLFMKRS
jgi:predicted nucleic acid-binding protein